MVWHWLLLGILGGACALPSSSTENSCCNTTCCDSMTGPLVLRNTIFDDFGDWGPWDFCPKGTYFTAYQQLYDEPFDEGEKCDGDCKKFINDNTELNGVQFFCAKFGENRFVHHKPTSYYGLYGEYRAPKYCDLGVITGFELRINVFQNMSVSGKPIDNVGAVGLNVYCVGVFGKFWLLNEALDIQELSTEDRHTGARIYTPKQFCRPGQAITAIRTQVDRRKKGNRAKYDKDDINQYYYDVRGLVNLEMMCEDIPLEVEHCTPKITNRLLSECNNVEGTSMFTCAYESTIGTQVVVAKTPAESNKDIILEALDISLMNGAEAHYHKMSHALYKAAGHNRTNLFKTSYFWSSEAVDTEYLDVKPHSVSRIFQVVGSCGGVESRSANFITNRRLGAIPNPLPNEGFVCKTPEEVKNHTSPYEDVNAVIFHTKDEF